MVDAAWSRDQRTLGARVRKQLEQLLPVFHLEPHRDVVLDLFELVTRESLSLDLDAPLPRFSTINNDGVPLEISLSLGGREGGLRLLTEIGVPGSSVARRIQLTWKRLSPVLQRIGLVDALPLVKEAVAPLFPRDPTDLVSWHGALWVALVFLPDGRTGLRLYVNGAVGDRRDRWLRASGLLARLGRMSSVAELCDLSPKVSAFAEPLGIAVDVVPGGIGRVKFYLRSAQLAPGDLEQVLTASGLGAGIERLQQFTTVQCGGRRWLPPQSVVLSLEFLPSEPARVDVKIDTCCHCLFRDDEAAYLAARRLIAEWALPPDQHEALLAVLAGGPPSRDALRHYAFFGLGFAHDQEPRLNLYLKPGLACDRGNANGASGGRRLRAGSREGALAERAVTGAIDFLLERQGSCGQWIDFALPVGPSDAWVTAYIGLVLAELPPRLQTPALRAALDRAAEWCLDAMGPDYGWGYNAFTGSDADSSAHAIRFLRRVGRVVPAEALARLHAFQRPDGGFATYRREDPDDTWGHSHADVTAAVLLAFSGELSSPAVSAGTRYAAAQQNQAGRWPSYWWRSDHYATRMNVQALTRLDIPFRARACAEALAGEPPPPHPFEIALRLATLADLDALARIDVDVELARLATAQDRDGAWTSSPMLRLTDPRCAAPWAEADSGRLYADQRCLFTTATVLAGLSSLRER